MPPKRKGVSLQAEELELAPPKKLVSQEDFPSAYLKQEDEAKNISKFYNIRIDPVQIENQYYVIIEYGRIGTKGSSDLARFTSYQDANKYYAKKLRAKINDGYQATGVQQLQKPDTSIKKTKPNQKEKDDFQEIHRKLVCVEGNSSKFYNVSLTREDEIYIIRFTWGKINGVGRSNSVQYNDRQQAVREFEKIVREKLKKGYTDSDNPDQDNDQDGEDEEQQESQDLSAITNKIKKWRRQAFIPQVAEGDGTLFDSKYLGKPFIPLHANEEGGQLNSLPTCKQCNYNLRMIFQLNFAQAPTRLKGLPYNGLFQFYLCCEDNCMDYDEESGCTDLRYYSENQLRLPANPLEGVDLQRMVETTGTAKTITGWQPKDDYPNIQEAGEKGFKLSQADEDEFIGKYPRAVDKFSGWPCWIQDAAYPSCKLCNKEMVYFYQIESCKIVKMTFGDAGNFHFFICQQHPQELAYEFACC